MSKIQRKCYEENRNGNGNARIAISYQLYNKMMGGSSLRKFRYNSRIISISDRNKVKLTNI